MKILKKIMTIIKGIIKYLKTLLLFLIGRAHKLELFINHKSIDLIRLGSNYGGKYLLNSRSLHDKIIVSAGVGEDISFDIEFLNEFGGKIILIDPTPRAKIHFEETIKRIGAAKTENYSNTGKQEVTSYSMENLNHNQFIYVDKALSNSEKELKFYKPKDENFVSHSIIENQSNDFIKVKADRLVNVLDDLKINKENIELIKLDIEGAETEVIIDMLFDNICPNQILIEIDRLGYRSKKSVKEVDRMYRILIENGYKLKHRSDLEMLFVSKKLK